jgi:uncharacterized OB-fold protein
VKSPRVLPVVDDRDTGGFWESAERGQLSIRVCDHCGEVLHLPRANCNQCGSWESSWKPTSGRGHLHSWTVVTHQVHPGFRPPYTIVLVELADYPAVRLIGYLDGDQDLHAGQAMEVWFEQVGDGTVLPQWRPAS